MYFTTYVKKTYPKFICKDGKERYMTYVMITEHSNLPIYPSVELKEGTQVKCELYVYDNKPKLRFIETVEK